jgi:hypothetical protein
MRPTITFMSSTTRIEAAVLLAAALALGGCEREPAGDTSAEIAQARVEPADAPSIAAYRPPSQDRAGTAAPAEPGLAGTVREREDVTVNGERACALTVRYGGGEEQPVTWRGEGCAQVLVRLASLQDLEKIGQDVKLSEEARDDLARMPAGRAVYVEGSHSSSLYPENVMGRVYEVPLAD